MTSPKAAPESLNTGYPPQTFIENNTFWYTTLVHPDDRAQDSFIAYRVVSDTGPGISGEAQYYIFEAFRQEDLSEMRRHDGVGLSIVSYITATMGGRLNLTS